MTAARTVVANWPCERRSDSASPVLFDRVASALDARVGDEDAQPIESCV